MKKITVLSILFTSLLAFAYCTPKAGKDLQKSKTPTLDLSKFTAADLEQGNKIMREKCGSCHVMFEPEDFYARDWHEILKSMLPKSKLYGHDADLVSAYIISNARPLPTSE